MVILLTVNKENNIFTKKDKLEKKKDLMVIIL